MTREQFEHIQGLLEEWRESRGLSVEVQKANFKVNYTKELIEFFEAERDGNECEMIDALCDMIVVAINAGYGLSTSWLVGMREVSNEVMLLSYDEIKVGVIHLCESLRYYDYDPYKCLLETIKELESRSGAWNEKEGKWVKDVGAYTHEEAKQKAKELCSRGEDEIKSINATITRENSFYVYILFNDGKFESKNIKKWYKADYSKCKL